MKARHKLIGLALCSGVSIVSVGFLFLFTQRANQLENPFVRLFPPGVTNEIASMDIAFNSYYFAGLSPTQLYLGNVTAPLHVLSTSIDLSDSQHVRLRIDSSVHVKANTMRVRIRGPYFYLYSGSQLPGLLRGTTHNWLASRFTYDRIYFDECVPIGSSSFALRTARRSTNEYELGKLGGERIPFRYAEELLEKQVDGKFCVDGMLHYDVRTARMVYVYYYRNEYVVADSSLRLLYRGTTIDTLRTAQIKVTTLSSEQTTMLAAPPLIVNQKSNVWNDLLFVQSGRMARNERRSKFNHATVIDVYALSAHRYLFSFYLPDRDGKKLRDFMIGDNRLYALYDHYLVSYALTEKYFKAYFNSASLTYLKNDPND